MSTHKISEAALKAINLKLDLLIEKCADKLNSGLTSQIWKKAWKKQLEQLISTKNLVNHFSKTGELSK